MFDHLQLDRRLILGLEALDLTEPTEVQRLVIPAAMAGVDLRIRAKTGTGKTLAYLLPTAELILASPAVRTAGTLALVLVPTRELARQVLKHCRALLAKSGVGVQAITGGADFKYQQALFRRNPEIIIATPGRLLEHCERRSVDFSALRVLVLDEADRMLEMGFREDVLKINEHCNPDKQVLMLSATLKHRGMGDIANALLRSPQTITVGEMREPHGNIFHQRILTDTPRHKDQVLTALLQAGGFQRALVFTNRRRDATRLAGLLRYHGLRCADLHGELTTEERKLVMSRFADGKLDVVCASDLAARGLDVKDIDLVINYDLPRSGEDYLHRTGRTGRAGAKGLAISLVGAADWNLMISIERYLKIAMESRALPGLAARYKGPKNRKTSGKAVGTRKKSKDKDGIKSKTRQRNKKNKGKRQAGNEPATPAGNDGFAPLMKKKPRP